MNQTCPHCGKIVDVTAHFCPDCGKPLKDFTPGLPGAPTQEQAQATAGPTAPPQVPYIPNNLALAIIAVVLCWPLGIPAIVYATQVDGLARAQQYDAARRNAELAKKWSIAAIGLLIAGVLIYFLIFVVMFGVMAIVPAITQN